MFYIHILTHIGRIENIKEKIFKVLTTETEKTYFTEGMDLRERRYLLHCGKVDIDVCCPEIGDPDSASRGRYLILPEFLVPGHHTPPGTKSLRRMLVRRKNCRRTGGRLSTRATAWSSIYFCVTTVCCYKTFELHQ